MNASGVALIADDDEFFRIALGFILKSKLRFTEIIETGSLDEAIERLSEREDVSLALFDLAMPGMQSVASLAAVRDVHPDLKVAVVSASSRRSDILSALTAGINGYVPKGLGATDLAEAVRAILNGSVYVPPSIAGRAPPSEAETPAPGGGVQNERHRTIEFLTPRQREVLQLLVQGFSNKEIARKLKLGEGTVKIHMAALFRSLRVRNRQEAAAAGARLLPMTENRQ
ncbi:response regulator transcription factor (plasmid) [Sinorhizobium meliloti WSM1022]|jgi:DNA-binding NarL/FixJ family response regulator|uniref:Response regulator n=2 Tax=Rhizobium meliloti TaxID=382 RepID=A0A6A7ZZG8_RHIML|nr:response regulator transcription factor [Sinorhizobium meliloti]AGA09250.1 Response regulator containing a CheY-like receiver domain and an HTH DNA-binding domain [Sinorhizobium meliloti GR4]ASJ61881.1 DNA-binding response regulator [Sinorhizobium meliloti]ASQ12279.1 DNA-binding response regulator [Sinorhizobium meliloti]MCK3785056.1 response regulator transcription factor [Sinorhizobium meliloti]MCK3791181.1 response regulator transcription factor [Sinorhizobium meliloti]